MEDLSVFRLLSVRAGADPDVVLTRIREVHGVESASIVGPGPRPSFQPSDPLWNEQWSLHQVNASFCGGFLVPAPNSSINMPAAWDLPPYPPDLRIGIIDTGFGNFSIDASQFDPSAPPVSYAPFDPSVEDDNPIFPHHGTAVSSITAARTDNSFGLAAPPFDQPIPEPPFTVGMPVSVKWFGVSGGNWPSVTSCINHIRADPAGRFRVANMSLHGTPPADPFERKALLHACKNAFLDGILLVASAGNDNDSIRTWPASLDDFVLAVGACLWNNLYWNNVNASPFVPITDSLVNGSTWGSWVDLVAPGGLGITAAKNRLEGPPNPYASYFTLQDPDPVRACNMRFLDTVAFGGTSAAAPFVSGVAAWLLRLRPSLTPEDAGQVILRTCTDMGATGFDVRFGNGRLNAGAAASFVTFPNWVHHGSLGEAGDAPLVAQGDSAVTTIVLSNADGISDGPHSCVRYRLAGQAQFNAGFLQPPAVWVRRAETRGVANTAEWDDDQRAPWGFVSPPSSTGATLETFVYRLTDAGNRWYLVSPDSARVAYTAIGPSGTLSVPSRLASAPLSVRLLRTAGGGGVRFALSGVVPGPMKAELFDVTGRRVAVLTREVSEGGSLELEWDGRDSNRSPLRRGIYFCRVTQLSAEAVQRFAWY